MKQTLLMERVLDETRLAVIEDGRLAEIQIERPNEENLSGNIYLGRVENVLPGMNAAFVDIGMEKNGFLAAGDIRLFAQGDRDLAKTLGQARIEKLARPGQEMLAQADSAVQFATSGFTLGDRVQVLGIGGSPFTGHIVRMSGKKSRYVGIKLDFLGCAFIEVPSEKLLRLPPDAK